MQIHIFLSHSLFFWNSIFGIIFHLFHLASQQCLFSQFFFLFSLQSFLLKLYFQLPPISQFIVEPNDSDYDRSHTECNHGVPKKHSNVGLQLVQVVNKVYDNEESQVYRIVYQHANCMDFEWHFVWIYRNYHNHMDYLEQQYDYRCVNFHVVKSIGKQHQKSHDSQIHKQPSLIVNLFRSFIRVTHRFTALPNISKVAHYDHEYHKSWWNGNRLTSFLNQKPA